MHGPSMYEAVFALSAPWFLDIDNSGSPGGVESLIKTKTGWLSGLRLPLWSSSSQLLTLYQKSSSCSSFTGTGIADSSTKSTASPSI